MAETRVGAEDAFDFFVRAYAAKYDKAVECLTKDRDRLLTFYNFPAEHWARHQLLAIAPTIAAAVVQRSAWAGVPKPGTH